MKFIPLLFLLALQPTPSAQWTPPDASDRRAASSVYGEILSDTNAERYDEALVKCVWYIDNVKPTRAMHLFKAWHDLATKYPPALKRLKEVSDDSKRRLLDGEGKHLDELFAKYTSIQKLVSPQTVDADTVMAFAALDKLSARAAMREFRFAMPALTRAKEVSLCRKYLEPQEQYDSLVRILSGRKVASAAAFAEQYFKTNTLDLIAALVLCKMNQDAEEVAAAAKKELDDKTFHARIDEALAGEIVNTEERSGSK